MFSGKRSVGKRRILPQPITRGQWLSTYETEGSFSLAAGSSQVITENFRVNQYSKLHLHAWLNAEVTLTIEWSANGIDWIVAPSPTIIPASLSSVGTVHEVSIHSPYYRITALNSDTVPLTFLKVSVYGAKK